MESPKGLGVFPRVTPKVIQPITNRADSEPDFSDQSKSELFSTAPFLRLISICLEVGMTECKNSGLIK